MGRMAMRIRAANLALASAQRRWDRRVQPRCHQRLRQGDEVDVAGLQVEAAGPRHPNSYRPAAVLRAAWSAVGRSLERSGIDGTHRASEIITGVAGILLAAQAAKLSQALDDVSVLFVLTRSYDFTPMQVGFGALQAELMPHARYWKHDGQRWVIAAFQERAGTPTSPAPLRPIRDGPSSPTNPTPPIKEMSRNSGLLRYGTVEVFAECLMLHHAAGEAGVVAHKEWMPPIVAERGNACCTFEALERSVPESTLR